MMVWSTQKILSLIEDIRCSPCLWDMRHVDYRNRVAKTETYEALGRKYGVNPMEIGKKFQILRTQFRREHKKVESMKKTSQWFGYEPLLFLAYDLDDPASEDQIFVSFSECEATATAVTRNPLNEVVFKSEMLENDSTCNRVMEFDNSLGKDFEINVVEDQDSQQLLRYSRKSTNRSSLFNRDEYAVYGEHIANKLRNCGRSRLEIAMAQHEIDSVCFKLTMGAYKDHLGNLSVGAVTVSDAGNCDENVSSATLQE